MPGHLKTTLLTVFTMSNLLLSSELLIPALPQIASSFNAPSDFTQLLVAANLSGVTIFAFIYGPLSDIYGRRIILQGSLLVFAIISIACMFTHSVTELVILRFFQGGAGAGSTVLSLTMINDAFSGKRASELLTRVVFISFLTRLFAPLAGGFLTTQFGWQSTFAFMSTYACLLIIGLQFSYNPVKAIATLEKDASTTFLKTFRSDSKKMLKSLASLLTFIPFLCGIIIHSSHFFGKWVYVTIAPFLFSTMDINAQEYGFYAAVGVCFFGLSSVYGQVILKRSNAIASIQHGIGISTFGAIILLCLYFMDASYPLIIAIGSGLFIGVTSILGPNGASIAMEAAPNKGAGASIISSSRTFSGLLGALVGAYMPDTALLPVIIIFFLTSCAPLIALKVLKRHGSSVLERISK